MFLLANFIQEWFLSIKILVHDLRFNNKLLYFVLIALVSITLLVCMKFVIKSTFNVSKIKRNFVFPLIMAIICVLLLILLCTM